MCYSLFPIESWEKLEQILVFFYAYQCIYMYILIYFKASFPGIRVWNILLIFHMYVDEMMTETGIVCVFCQLIISLLGLFCVRRAGVIVKFSLCVAVRVKESTFFL